MLVAALMSNMEMPIMKWFRWCSISLGVICLIIGLSPDWRMTIKPLADGATETRQILTLGIAPSPLLLVEKTDSTPVKSTRPDGELTIKGGNSHMSHHSSLEIGFVSWSMLALVLGALLFEAARRWGRDHRSISGN
jgi:hypothetical protein